MTDKINGPIFGSIKFILYLASLVYELGLSFRRLFYKLGIFKSARLPIKVISVGNLTLGGTGKTPFVIMLSRLIKDELDKEVCVLTRGYGWDEQMMLKKNLPEIPVLVGENRVKAATRAIKLYGSEASVLDDGFQYWELQRDLNIVLIDSRNPFGNRHLFPRGILREKENSIKRADIVVFTKVNKKTFDIGKLKDDFKKVKGDILFLEAMHKPKYIYDTKMGKASDLSLIKGKRTILLSSIGDPEYFEETVKDLGADVIEHLIYPDHYDYSQKDASYIQDKCDERSFDHLLTTEKDAVKLGRLHLSIGNYILIVLAVEMELVSGKEALIDRLHRLYIS